jgi:hypothetical protein
MNESDEIGSTEEVMPKFFLSSVDEKIHEYPIEDEPVHVEYKNEKIYSGPSALTCLINTEPKGKTARPCPVCSKGKIWDRAL